MEAHDTETTGVEDHNRNDNTEPEYEPRKSTRIRIQNQGVEQTNHNEDFEYTTLWSTFRDLEPCSPEEMIVRIKMPNERQNYYNTMDFIANEARRDQMIDDYIVLTTKCSL